MSMRLETLDLCLIYKLPPPGTVLLFAALESYRNYPEALLLEFWS